MSLGDVSVHTGREVLIEVDFHFADCWQSTMDFRPTAQVGNTKGGSIAVLLTSCLTGLD